MTPADTVNPGQVSRAGLQACRGWAWHRAGCQGTCEYSVTVRDVWTLPVSLLGNTELTCSLA